MLSRFIQHVRENNILDVHNRYLLAISGGADSVALAHLMHRAGFDFELLHCNFHLRGKESDGDAAFVQKLADRLGLVLHVRDFAPEPYMQEQGLSLQMAARELRYQWFAQMHAARNTHGVLLAHHADDQLETILLNLMRGTGIEGLYGMSERRDYIFRPLLPFKRAEIVAFLEENALDWREDSSNSQTIYKRNYLRHELIPVVEKRDPSGPESMRTSFERIKDTGKAFFYFFEQWRKKNVVQEFPVEYLPFSSLQGVPGKASLLFYWLRNKGFVYGQVLEILQAMEENASGKCFFSGEWMLNVDRENLILGKESSRAESIELEQHAISFRADERRTYEIIQLKGDWQLDRSPENAQLDKQLLEFPLLLRNWQQGDRFRPLGMRQFKKVSDFLIDLKVPLITKNQVKVLCSGGEIAWVVGYRIDDRFKLTGATREVVYFKKKQNGESV
ncbi:tRNA(Ile)-lysidine synthase [Cyclobacterium xiamenense]|jgi:tRNA(Ile)-lysidine synthase|uniref:tRNA(Ile)-lysidine synthase n=1 Tax=Cyclobacterium xiamenense TaxID=1297121 RepID=A0A1H6WTC2_9BACT|nr:tRNA lysidine(34) synthetase TilS [Cyclobacterium xiamenense]SEJ20083.1 tRNA(Ile)-lysidine synthase [Cyclobacterium xiamenense]